LLEAEDVHAVCVEHVVDGAESFLLAKSRFDELDELDIASWRLPIADSEAAGETMPVWLIALR